MKYLHLFLTGGVFMLTAATAAIAADNQNLPGYTKGADVIQVNTHQTQIDSISDVVYGQVISTRSQTHLSLIHI